MTVAQMFCYLTEYAHGPLPQSLLDRLQEEFDLARRLGVKALLWFAYEQDDTRKDGPTAEQILKHVVQLKPVVRKNTDVIYVLQAGFIGAWGEWRSGVHLGSGPECHAPILKAILELCPPDRMTQVRTPHYKHQAVPLITGKPYQPLSEATAFTAIPEARIGFHNDGVLASNRHGETWKRGPGDPEFDLMTQESAWLPVDGELFWGDAMGAVDGLEAAKYLRLHHFTTLSISHSYSEREGKPLGIDRWRSTPITGRQLEKARLPISDGYFEDIIGQPVQRTQFEYVRDHLGYRLELREAAFPAEITRGDNWRVSLKLINRGFATPINPREVRLLLVSREGKVAAEIPLACDPRRWQPYRPGDPDYEPLVHNIDYVGRVPENLPAGEYSLALWLPDPQASIRPRAAYAIRLANRDVSWWQTPEGQYGANLFGVVRVR